MEKNIRKLEERQGKDSEQAKTLKKNVEELQSFVRGKQLEPMLRASYTRTAFQIPGDDRIRISIDTDLAFIREDALDRQRPCRDPEEWHRTDIDTNELEYPFSTINKGEVVRFPHAVLEIKIKDSKATRNNSWLSDLMNSHLVREAPQFSKFVHGVAQLFEDYVNSFPFWLSELDTDIRRDPEVAFLQEQQKQAQKAEDEFAVGSFLPARSFPCLQVSEPKRGRLTDSRQSPGHRPCHFSRNPIARLILPVSPQPRGASQKAMGSKLLSLKHRSLPPLPRDFVLCSLPFRTRATPEDIAKVRRGRMRPCRKG